MKKKDHKQVLAGSVFVLMFFVIISAELKAMEVQIIPAIPTNNDIIQIKASGILASLDAPFDHSDFFINGFSLQLDIYYGDGYLTALGPWLHTEFIGPLPGGTYDLTITQYEGGFQSDDTYTSFEVIPEPMSILLFSIGVLVLHLRRSY